MFAARRDASPRADVTAGGQRDGANARGDGGWLAALRAWIAAMALGNFVWEFAQLPLYALWDNAGAQEILFDALHCFAGDMLIGLAARAAALIFVGDENWPARRFAPVAVFAFVLGLAYTGFSEWLNVTIRKSWAYSPLMPTIRLFDFPLGLSPLLQWIFVPAGAFWWCGRRRPRA